MISGFAFTDKRIITITDVEQEAEHRRIESVGGDGISLLFFVENNGYNITINNYSNKIRCHIASVNYKFDPLILEMKADGSGRYYEERSHGNPIGHQYTG
jgi:hypothetical protein